MDREELGELREMLQDLIHDQGAQERHDETMTALKFIFGALVLIALTLWFQ